MDLLTNIFFISFSILFFVECYGQSEVTAIVQTTKGPVQGLILKTVWNNVKYSAFRAIPYAQPPLEYLRFKPPVDIQPWTETRKAFSDPNVCPQVELVTQELIGNEDCLYLNVYTPLTTFNNQQEKKAVMVWIHGGAFFAGDSNSTFYGPDFLIEDDVVVVTLNYRLGALGFLALEHPNATGNAGMKDQVLALKWVQQNIQNFGGDPRKVTIFGESAGGCSVDLHMISERSRGKIFPGLFQRSITMSGSDQAVWSVHAPDVAKTRAFKLGQNLGYTTRNPSDLLTFLYKVPPLSLANATMRVAGVQLPFVTPSPTPTLFTVIPLDIPFKPTIEDPSIVPRQESFLYQCPNLYYKNQNWAKQPHMRGYVKRELATFTPVLAIFIDLVQFLITAISILTTFVPGLQALNLGAIFSALQDSDALLQLIIDLGTDLAFVAPNNVKQKILSASNGFPVYYYRLSYDSIYSIHNVLTGVNVTGPGHADDLTYVFHVSIVDAPKDPNHEYNQFRKKMVRFWTNFAKYGNPTPNGANDPLLRIQWPDSGPQMLMMDIGEQFTVRPDLSSPLAKGLEGFTRVASELYLGCRGIGSMIFSIFS